jgi:hypothetical protein
VNVLLLSKVRIVLIVSLAIEALNFFLLAPPIDVDVPPGTPWFIKLMAIQWVIIHAPGLFTANWWEGVSGCRQVNVLMSCRRVDLTVLFVSGYLTTAFFLILVIFVIRRFLFKKIA